MRFPIDLNALANWNGGGTARVNDAAAALRDQWAASITDYSTPSSATTRSAEPDPARPTNDAAEAVRADLADRITNYSG